MNELWKIGAILIAILLITCGAVGYGMATGMFKGEKGEKGDIGLAGTVGSKGNDGIDGTNGKDGKDAPINHPPEISLITQSGDFVAYVPTILNSCKYTYNIVVNVSDDDNDTMKVTFYYSGKLVGPWIEKEAYFGENGTYNSTVVYSYNQVFRIQKTMYWCVEVWDGNKISTERFNYTITP